MASVAPFVTDEVLCGEAYGDLLRSAGIDLDQCDALPVSLDSNDWSTCRGPVSIMNRLRMQHHAMADAERKSSLPEFEAERCGAGSQPTGAICPQGYTQIFAPTGG